MLKTFTLKKVTCGHCSKDKQVEDFVIDGGDVKIIIEGVEMKDICETQGEELDRCDGGEIS